MYAVGAISGFFSLSAKIVMMFTSSLKFKHGWLVNLPEKEIGFKNKFEELLYQTGFCGKHSDLEDCSI